MKKINLLLFSFLFTVPAAGIYAQSSAGKIKGRVLSTLNKPIEGAVVSVTDGIDATTDKNGYFQIECKDPSKATLTIWADGFYGINQQLNNRENVRIVMIPTNGFKYNEAKVLPFRIEDNVESTSAENLAKEDFVLGRSKIDRALSGQIAGLQVTAGSGMPGEGSYMNLRGIRSFVGNNAPLVVINGVPYIPDTNDSQLIGGLSRDIFQAYNIDDIQNITVLKGAEAAIYGSMGANGVILIETDGAKSDNLETQISYYGQFGVNWNNKRMSLLNGIDYKSYLTDIGIDYYDTMDEFFTNFPFMQDANSRYNYLYNNNTDWQDQIYQNGFTTDNLVRVEGGDAIAKYDLSLGYSMQEGILKGTNQNRFHTQLNGNVAVSSNFEIYTTVGLAYLDGDYQEQGMDTRTNPILAAYSRSPLLSPYQKNDDGSVTPIYSNYYYGICENMDFAVSNPLALVNTLDANSRQYDVNVKVGFNYRPIQDLTVNGVFGLYYNYNKEHVFIPGKDEQAIIPVTDIYGEEINTVRDGVGETINYFYNLNARYNKTFSGRHALNAMVGFQALTTQHEYDGGFGRNTANDFYQVMDATESIGRYIQGYLEKWNWMNLYAHADYTWNNILTGSFSMSVDGSSATGNDTNRFRVYPAGGVTWMVKNMPALQDKDWLSRLDVRAEYSLTGNSRFSSTYGKSFYVSSPYMDVSGIIRNQIPNTNLRPEKTRQMNLSLDAAFLRNRIEVGVDYYLANTNDVIMPVTKSSVYGTSPYYANCGRIDNQGVELSLQASLVRLRDFEWIVGGNIAFTDNKVKSLGGNEQMLTTFSDGSQVVSRVGGTPYEFYGLQAEGVYSTQTEADQAGLINTNRQAYQAGDVRYVDQNGDGMINYKDYVSLGNATPDYFGGFYTHIRYKGFALTAEFSYSQGNKAYNAVRRSLESVSTFSNQSAAVVNRWSLEGQQTDIPRATYGDPIGNNDFSSRWIEDASYLRMKNITLSYTFDKPVWNFFRSGTIYVTGENLWTLTDYLGMDPEFAYSSSTCATQGFDWGKVMQPKSVKLGINLKF